MIKKSDITDFPSTRYQGSKRKILFWLYQNLKNLDFDTVLDACGGTGSVSYLLKKMGKEVVYNDKLRFNYEIGKAIIENDKILLSEKDIDTLLDSTNNLNYSFIENTFKGIYYTTDENKWLDGVLTGIHSMNGYEPNILEYKKAIAFYSLFQACLTKRPFNLFHRRNLDLRLNDVQRNFGNKTTWEKTFDEQFRNFAKEANSKIFKSSKNCLSRNQSIFEIENLGYDLVYIDPPYINSGKNETADYLKCYHFLEGMVKWKDWKEMIDYETSNRRFLNHQESNDFKKSTIHQSMESIFEKFQDSIIVLSYKKGGIPSIEELKKLLGKFKDKVFTRSMHYQYALNKQNGDAKNNREVLIIGI